MKYIYVFLFAAGLGSAHSQQIDDSRNGILANKRPATFMKLMNTKPWTASTNKLIAPGTGGRAEQIVARQAVYTVTPKPEAGQLNEFGILAVQEPHTKTVFMIDAEHSFYVADKSGLVGYTLVPGALVWSKSYLEVPDSPGALDTAIARFELEIDGRKLNQEWSNRATVNRVSLREATTAYFFSDAPQPGGMLVKPQVNSVEATSNDVLRIHMQNPKTGNTATITVNIRLRRVIKSVVNGEEMNLLTDKPYATPLKGK